MRSQFPIKRQFIAMENGEFDGSDSDGTASSCSWFFLRFLHRFEWQRHEPQSKALKPAESVQSGKNLHFTYDFCITSFLQLHQGHSALQNCPRNVLCNVEAQSTWRRLSAQLLWLKEMLSCRIAVLAFNYLMAIVYLLGKLESTLFLRIICPLHYLVKLEWMMLLFLRPPESNSPLRKIFFSLLIKFSSRVFH